MSTEYQTESYEVEPAVVRRYSSFGPLAILIVGLLLWSGYQAFTSYSQNAALTAEFKQAEPTINAAQNMQARLYAVAQDLVQTSSKDPYAAQIVKEANIQVRSNGSTGH
jgi:predicted negative regulator of RcsB-dependent stress response